MRDVQSHDFISCVECHLLRGVRGDILLHVDSVESRVISAVHPRVITVEV